MMRAPRTNRSRRVVSPAKSACSSLTATRTCCSRSSASHAVANPPRPIRRNNVYRPPRMSPWRTWPPSRSRRLRLRISSSMSVTVSPASTNRRRRVRASSNWAKHRVCSFSARTSWGDVRFSDCRAVSMSPGGATSIGLGDAKSCVSDWMLRATFSHASSRFSHKDTGSRFFGSGSRNANGALSHRQGRASIGTTRTRLVRWRSSAFAVTSRQCGDERKSALTINSTTSAHASCSSIASRRGCPGLIKPSCHPLSTFRS